MSKGNEEFNEEINPENNHAISQKKFKSRSTKSRKGLFIIGVTVCASEDDLEASDDNDDETDLFQNAN